MHKATQANEETKKATAKERIQMEVLGSYNNDGKLDIANLLSNIEKNIPEASVSGNEFPITVTLDGYTFTVDDKGNVELVTTGSIVNTVKPLMEFNFNQYIDKKLKNDFIIQGGAQIELSSQNYKNGGKSCYFPGTAAQRITLNAQDLNFGTSDFTVEFWSYSDTQVMPYALFFGDDANAHFKFFIQCATVSNNISLVLGDTPVINTNKKYTTNAWVHYAVVRKNGVFTIYENGTNIGSTNLYKNIDINLQNLSIGGNVAAGYTSYKGYIDNFAIYGTSLYDENFTPPIHIDESAILSANFDDKIECIIKKQQIADTSKTFEFTAHDGAKIELSDVQCKSQERSCYFPGTATQRITLNTQDLDFGTSDFTIEFWSYSDTQVMPYALFFGDDANAQFKFFIQCATVSNNISLILGNTPVINTNKKYTANEWVHYAVVRKDGVFTIYENGTDIGSTDLYKDTNVNLQNLSIGGNSSVANTAYKGYIDDFKIYKTALY